jgi:hypothetical protein
MAASCEPLWTSLLIVGMEALTESLKRVMSGDIFFPTFMSRPAVNSSGNLKDASDILFYHSESDTHAIVPNLPASGASSSQGELLAVRF